MNTLLKILNMVSDIDSIDKNGNTILHHLINEEDDNIVKEFIEIALMKGKLETIINHQNNNRETPLHLTVKLEKQKLADFLVKYGADPNIMDINGNMIRWVKTMNGGGKSKKLSGFRKI